jgi:hypothetical protein
VTLLEHYETYVHEHDAIPTRVNGLAQRELAHFMDAMRRGTTDSAWLPDDWRNLLDLRLPSWDRHDWRKRAHRLRICRGPRVGTHPGMHGTTARWDESQVIRSHDGKFEQFLRPPRPHRPRR